MLYGENNRFPSPLRNCWYRAMAKSLFPCTSWARSDCGTLGAAMRTSLDCTTCSPDKGGSGLGRVIGGEDGVGCGPLIGGIGVDCGAQLLATSARASQSRHSWVDPRVSFFDISVLLIEKAEYCTQDGIGPDLVPGMRLWSALKAECGVYHNPSRSAPSFHCHSRELELYQGQPGREGWEVQLGSLFTQTAAER